MSNNSLTLNLSSINSKDRPECNTVETNDEYFEELSVQTVFYYYETHDSHKLAMKLNKRDCFSVLRINICSLNVNPENLELLLTNLDHAFDVIGVSDLDTRK